MDIDWTKITIYEVDPVCKYPSATALTSYSRSCRCSKCCLVKSVSSGHRPRELRYIPEEEWTTP